MALFRLAVCVGGVYSMFLIWAIAQERLSVPFPSIDGSEPARFESALIMGLCQNILCALSSLAYIFFRRTPGQTFQQAIGLEFAAPTPSAVTNGHATQKPNGPAAPRKGAPFHPFALAWAYFQTSLLLTAAAPFGFAALAHISYPAMVLGKSCKLVPVMLMNILLYRRRFAPHKYFVVALVTAGITLFMFFAPDAARSKSKHAFKGKASAGSSLIGMLYLLINLILDGAINSTQDEIFSRYRVTGQQMMFFINIFSALISAIIAVLSLPYIPVLHPSHTHGSELSNVLAFIETHPGVILPLMQFALTGALGQLFIFETLQHFGSLTLVTITLTRKMFTLILSVVIYNHSVTRGQWAGALIVFAGIVLEAWVKRRDVHAKRVIQEKEKARIKQL